MRGQKPVLLHCGDLNPSGIAIPKAIKKRLSDRYGLDVDVRQIALTPEQVERYDLPKSIDAVKLQDPNHKKWLEQYGPKQAAVELDALHPETIMEIVKTALNEVYDIDGMDAEQAKEIEDRKIVRNIRRDILALLSSKYPSVCPGL